MADLEVQPVPSIKTSATSPNLIAEEVKLIEKEKPSEQKEHVQVPPLNLESITGQPSPTKVIEAAVPKEEIKVEPVKAKVFEIKKATQKEVKAPESVDTKAPKVVDDISKDLVE